MCYETIFFASVTVLKYAFFCNRFSSIVKTPGIRRSKEKKDLLRLQLKLVKEHSRALLEDRKTQKEYKRLRREANLKRREENRLKSEVVQVV
jgi:rRNA-processing protein CGR1